MMRAIDIPVVALGPGSQPDDDRLEYMDMPKGMHTYEPPRLPEPEEIADRDAARALLDRLDSLLQAACFDSAPVRLSLDGLDLANLALLNQALGEGEVSARVTTDPEIRVQETLFAGLWRVLGAGSDMLEIASYPPILREAAERSGRDQLSVPAAIPPGCMNAPGVLTEVAEHLAAYTPGQAARTVNLSLLPLTPEDADFIAATLGAGPVVILSRGYGNCRITATALRHLWRVQFFNSQDRLILDTLEVTEMPEVAVAAAEDLEDSRSRFSGVLQWLKSG